MGSQIFHQLVLSVLYSQIVLFTQSESNTLGPMMMISSLSSPGHFYLTRESLYEIFGPKISPTAINEVLNMTTSDTMQAFKVFINGPKAVDLLQLHQRSFMRPGDVAVNEGQRNGKFS